MPGKLTRNIEAGDSLCHHQAGAAAMATRSSATRRWSPWTRSTEKISKGFARDRHGVVLSDTFVLDPKRDHSALRAELRAQRT
ncbi:MAG: hypothetical protein R3C69_04090 [Geminicoccaceae bacterium]